jgi:hypothetical protein
MAAWAVVWRVLVGAYAIYNLGGAPGAAQGWKDVFQPLGFGRVVGLLLLVAIVVSLLPAGVRLRALDKTKGWFHRDKPAPAPARSDKQLMRKVAESQVRSRARNDKIEAELVAIIDEGKALGPSTFQPAEGWGPYKLWADKAGTFIQTVFGDTEGQRYIESYDPPPDSIQRNVDDRLRRLRDLRDRRDTWKPQVDSEELQEAIEKRRSRSFGERIVEANKPKSALGPPNASTKRTPESPERASTSTRTPGGSLVALEREYTNGDRMLKACRPLPTFMHGLPPSDADIDTWKKRVLAALPESYKHQFRFAPLESASSPLFSMHLHLLESEQAKRLRRHMEELERIIEALT